MSNIKGKLVDRRTEEVLLSKQTVLDQRLQNTKLGCNGLVTQSLGSELLHQCSDLLLRDGVGSFVYLKDIVHRLPGCLEPGLDS